MEPLSKSIKQELWRDQLTQEEASRTHTLTTDRRARNLHAPSHARQSVIQTAGGLRAAVADQSNRIGMAADGAPLFERAGASTRRAEARNDLR